MVPKLLKVYDSVVIASLEQKKIFAVHEPMAGIILAAGESTRYGKPKQLLDWQGQPFVRAVAKTALEAGLSPVVVITGANAEGIEAALRDLNVKIIQNDGMEKRTEQFDQGRGHHTLPNPATPIFYRTKDSIVFGGGWVGAGAAIFLLVDQPQITTSILRALMEKHAEGLYPVVAPW